MKHKNYIKRGLALLLCAIMCIGLFSGCSNNNEETTSAADEKSAEASEVNYRTDGAYTTTITLTGMSFADDIMADDITLVTAASKLDEESQEAADEAETEAVSDDETATETDLEEVKALESSNVEITSVTRKDDSTLEVSFTDDDSETNAVLGYSMTLAGKSIGEDEDATAYVTVNVDKNMTCDTENVLPDSKEIKLTMTAENDNFSSDITAENISLAGSFEGMEIASVSSANKNLTIQLTGELNFNEESNCYTDGFVYVDKDGFENGYNTSSVTVGVNEVAAVADSTTFSVKDGAASFDIMLCYDTFADDVSASDFVLEGATVTAFEKKDDTTGTLSFTVEGKNTANEIADEIFSKTLTIAATALTGGKELIESVGITQASFYPVFDYAEESDGTYTITLKLYSSNGTFAEDISGALVSFEDDFANAEVLSLTRDSDTVATLILTVPSNGVSVEDMDLYGTVILSEGSLLCEWGDVSEEEAYSRIYLYDEMGKRLNKNDIAKIKSIVGGFGNSVPGTISSVISGVGTGVTLFQGVQTILELSGVIESESVKLDKIYNCLQDMRKEFTAAFDKVEQQLDEVMIISLSRNVRDFDTYLSQLEEDLTYCEKQVGNASGPFNKIHPAPTEALTYGKDGKCTSSEALQKEWQDYYQGYLTYARENYNADSKYTLAVQRIERTLSTMSVWLTPGAAGDILSDFDTLCSKIYNFDAQSLDLRQNYRTTIQGYLVRAKATLTAYYLSGEPGSSRASSYLDSLEQDTKLINKCNAAIEGKTYPSLAKDSEGNDTMYMYATGKRFINAVYSIDYPMGMKKEEFISKVGNLGFLENSEFVSGGESMLKEFLSRMRGRTVREELLLLTDNIVLNPILIDNCIIQHVTWYNYPLAFCTEGFVETDIPKTGVTQYGCYVGYINLCDCEWDWDKEYYREMIKKSYKKGEWKNWGWNYAVDGDNYFSYTMYYFSPAK